MTAKHWRLEHDGTFRETEPGRGTWVYHADHKRETAQLQARVAELEAALRPALEFVELFSNRWDGQHGRHPFGIVTDARKALGVEE